MIYKLLADAVVLVHLMWIVFLCIGAVWGRKYRAVRIVHISALAFAVISVAFGWICPLTYLEVWLQSKYNPSLTYTGSFIAHYAEKIVYLDVSRTAVFALALLLVIFNALVYWRAGRH